MWTRRDMLRQTGAAAVLATTTPWWMMRRAHAARQHKLVVWNPAALAPQVDKIMEEQCYAYTKQAGIKENDIITNFNGTEVNSADEVAKLVKENKDKPTISLKIKRDGKVQTVEVKMPRKLKTADL